MIIVLFNIIFFAALAYLIYYLGYKDGCNKIIDSYNQWVKDKEQQNNQ
jgi:F0F1-type ATP synthase membrane subunit b/b'